MFLRPFVLYSSACFDILFVSILCTCRSHLFWYCFISFFMFCARAFSLKHWFFSLSNFVIPSECLKNFICAASKRWSSLFKKSFSPKTDFGWLVHCLSLKYSTQGNTPHACDYGSTDLNLRSKKVKVQFYIWDNTPFLLDQCVITAVLFLVQLHRTVFGLKPSASGRA